MRAGGACSAEQNERRPAALAGALGSGERPPPRHTHADTRPRYPRAPLRRPAALAQGAPPKAAANWVMGDIMAACKEAKIGMEQLAMTPQVGGTGPWP